MSRRALTAAERDVLRLMRSSRWQDRADAFFFNGPSHPELADAAVTALSDRSWKVIVQACAWIDRCPDEFRAHERVRGALEGLMESSRPAVAKAAGQALGRIGRKRRPSSRVRPKSKVALGLGELARLESSGRGIQQVTSDLKDLLAHETDPQLLTAALRLFMNKRQMPDPLVETVLGRFRYLEEHLDPGGRCVLIRSLASAARDNRHVRAALKPLTDDASPHVAWWAAEVLGH